jgi:hypothetical protein
MSKIIYVIGDSFSAGAELEDHTFESYKKYNPKNGDEYYSKWIISKEFQDELNSRIGYHKADAELKRAWPAKLASMTNSTVINKSWGGSGPAMWRANVLIDFLDFNKTNTTIDIAIIQVTDYNRSCLFISNEYNMIDYLNIGIFCLKHGTAYEKLFQKSKTMLQDDIGDFFNFLVDLATIKTILFNNGVKTIKIVGSCVDLSKTVSNNDYESKIIEINSLLNFLEIDFNKIAYLSNHTKTRLTGGHFDEDTHEKFALEMKKILNL